MYNHQLDTFIQAADAGSFSKAAEAMYISSTAVMKQINLLESSLAVPQWEGVHPLLKILPVEWNHTIPFGLLHSPAPSPVVQELIRTIARVM